MREWWGWERGHPQGGSYHSAQGRSDIPPRDLVSWADEMAQPVAGLSHKSGDVSLIPGIRVKEEGEKGFYRAVL